MATVGVYKGSIVFGTGTILSGARTMTGFTRVADRVTPSVERQVGKGRNVTLVVATDQPAKTMRTRVTSDTGGSTLQFVDAFPYAS